MERKSVSFLTFALAGIFLVPLATHAQSYLTDGSSTAAGNIYPTRYEASPSVFEVNAGNTNVIKHIDISPCKGGICGLLIAQEHRSAVASFVTSFLTLATSTDSMKEFEMRIRLIAQDQKDAQPSTTDAIEKISFRGAVISFFFGSDTENLATLKNELVRTQKDIARLKILSANIPVDSVLFATLTNQILALEKSQSNIQNFVASFPSSSGVLGWITIW